MRILFFRDLIGVSLQSMTFYHKNVNIIYFVKKFSCFFYIVAKNILKGHTVSVNALASFPNEDKSNLLISGSSDNSIKLWDFRQKQCVNTWKGHLMPINTIDCSYDGKSIVSGSQDELIKV